MDSSKYSSLEAALGYSFKDQALLHLALTHRSYSSHHNERLEFLGDAVLELAVTDHLFLTYPDRPEGELTAIRAALVNTLSISAAANELGAEVFLRLSKGEAKDTGRGRRFILANTYEAIIGAIYIDQGYGLAAKFIENTLLHNVNDIVENERWRDAKSVFQEQAQKHASVTPTYEIIDENGPDHDKVFTVGVFLDNQQIATGTGKSKQEAESVAAEVALEEKGWE